MRTKWILLAVAMMMTTALNGQVAKRPKAVNLGLSVRWADCNLEIKHPSNDCFYFFCWGETSPKAEDDATERNKWIKGGKIKKYNTLSQCGPVDNRKRLELQDDAASVNLKGKWRMPTRAEWMELRSKCKWEYDGWGYKVTGPSGNSIYLPVSCFPGMMAGECGYYWSSTLCTKAPYSAWGLTLGSEVIEEGMGPIHRTDACLIRPVTP